MTSNLAYQQKNRARSKSEITKNSVAQLNELGSSVQSISPSNIDTAKDHLYLILQTSLDLNELIALFKKEVDTILPIDSCHYRNKALDIHVGAGDIKPNNCSYRLITQDDYLGELVFTRKTRFNEAETKVLETLICTVIYPIRNALQYREAMHSALTDALTGAGNRVSLSTSLNREYELAKRYQQPLSLLMIDLDHFKRINDEFGHAAGDRVLQQVAKEIQKTSRCADMTFRFGGEEFVVLLNKTDQKGAEVIAERIRSAIANLSCTQDNIDIPITTSIGCTTLMETDRVDDLLLQADKALYEAKTSGRNQVFVAGKGQ